MAGEMEREGFTLPLLIGGATTSRVHTAVQIEPRVPRADGPRARRLARRRRGRAACSSDGAARRRSPPGCATEYAQIRDASAPGRRDETRRVPLAEARGATGWPSTGRLRPAAAVASWASARSTTTRSTSWSRPDRLDAVLRGLGAEGHVSRRSSTTRASGQAARKLFDDAQRAARPDRRASGCSAPGRWSASSPPTPSATTTSRCTPTTARGACHAASIHTLRQQMEQAAGPAQPRLADFVAPRDTGLADYVGAFAVTAGLGRGRAVRRVRGASTTTTPRSSPRPSPTAWPRRSPSGCTSGCAGSCGATRPSEALDNAELIAERYQGIRPAPGYPACPDHTEKADPLRAARRRAAGRASRSPRACAMCRRPR